MINFHKYGFLDAKRLKEYFKQYNFWLHRLNPIYLFIWSDLYKPEIAFTNDFIYIRYLDPAEGMCYYPPIGNGDMRLALYHIKEDAVANGFEFNISAIDASIKERLDVYRIKSFKNDDLSSYIYTTQALSLTDRRLYKRQIKDMYAFSAINPDTYFKLVKKDDFPAILEFVNEWSLKGGKDWVNIYQRLNMLKKCMDQQIPVPEALHTRMRDLLLKYVVVGGMPDAVKTFIETKQMNDVLQIQRDIIRSYEDDMVKYADKKDKAVIKECFQSIPKQLSKENKKFQYSVVKKGSTSAKFAGSLQWIEDAGIIRRCYNLSITELPLDGNAEKDIFKVYMQDTGLFISMLEDGTQFDILQGNLYAYKGAIFENLIADIFSKMGRKLYYFHKDSGLEVDFVIRYHGECTLVEVKAATGNTKSTKTILKHPEKYHVSSAIKLGDYNVGKMDQILTLPLYMAFLLNEF